MDTCLDTELKREYWRTLEFYAGHAFFLGLRTGVGLGEEMSAAKERIS